MARLDWKDPLRKVIMKSHNDCNAVGGFLAQAVRALTPEDRHINLLKAQQRAHTVAAELFITVQTQVEAELRSKA